MFKNLRIGMRLALGFMVMQALMTAIGAFSISRLGEMDTGAEQINRAIQQLDHVIQQNAGASEEMASTAEELSSQAEQLQSAVAFFRLDQGGGRGAVRKEARVQRPTVKNGMQPQVSRLAHANGYGKGAPVAGDGVFLELAERRDRLDAEFEKY